VRFAPGSTGLKTLSETLFSNAVPVPINILGRGASEQTLNGTFDAYPTSTAKIPTSWVAANFASTDGRDPLNKKAGAAGVRIGGVSGKVKTLTQTLSISGAATDSFLLSLWVKAASVPTSAGAFKIEVSLMNGASLVKKQTITFTNGSYTYALKSSSFTAGGTYNKVIIKLTYSKASGKAYFDELSLLKSP